MTFSDIRSISANSFKNIVKKQIQIKALEYLQQCQQTHSKSKHVTYHKLGMEEYLKPGNDLTIQEKQFIFKARTHMLNVKLNFKVGQTDLSCRHGCNVPEDQRHILDCTAIGDSCVANPEAPQYSDIFGVEVDRISTVGRMLMTRSKSFFQDHKPSKISIDHYSISLGMLSIAEQIEKVSMNILKVKANLKS